MFGMYSGCVFTGGKSGSKEIIGSLDIEAGRVMALHDISQILPGFRIVITSYSIHYTKLYENIWIRVLTLFYTVLFS